MSFFVAMPSLNSKNCLRAVPGSAEDENGGGVSLDGNLDQSDWAVNHAATAVPRTRSSTVISSSTCFAVNNPSGPLGVRSVKGDS